MVEKIIREPNKEYKLVCECDNCLRLFSFNKSDIINIDYAKFVFCPYCGKDKVVGITNCMDAIRLSNCLSRIMK